MMIELASLLPAVVKLARTAGASILTVYDSSDFQIVSKDDDSPLTAADLASHQAIIKGLSELTPEIPILSEESASIDYATRSQWSTYWLVDPLDGTKEFIKRNGEFTVNIALIQDHQPVMGVVYIPVQDICYFAAQGCGSQRQTDDNAAEAISVRQPRPATAAIVGSRSHASPSQQTFADNVGPHELVAVGSSLKFCLVASGQADVYPRFGPTSEWDTAAAQCVVEQAGGRVLTLEGDPLSYNKKASLLNPYFIVTGDSSYDWLAHLPADT